MEMLLPPVVYLAIVVTVAWWQSLNLTSNFRINIRGLERFLLK